MRGLLIIGLLSGCAWVPVGTTHVEIETELCGAPVVMRYASGQERKTATLRADCQSGVFELATTEVQGLEAQKAALESVGGSVKAVVDLVREISPAGRALQLWATPNDAQVRPSEP